MTTLLAIFDVKFFFSYSNLTANFFKSVPRSIIKSFGAKFNERLYLNVSIQSRKRKKKKEKKGQERKGIRLSIIWHLHKKKGKLLSGMYYRGRCLASSAFQCLHCRNRNKTCIYLEISRKQTKKMIRK